MKQEFIQEYAKLAIEKGVNLQKGQELIINAPVLANDLILACAEYAYQKGASKVTVNYSDDNLTRLHYQYQSKETLCDIKDWEVEQKVQPLRDGACVLRILSDLPEILAGIDGEKISAAAVAKNTRMKEASEYTMANRVQWSIIGYPNVAWAKQVFPELDENEAMEKLTTAILDSVMVKGNNDSVEAWDKHNKELSEHVEIMNNYNFKSLKFKNDLGTDLEVELVKNHIWAGGKEESTSGVIFNPNMPTEEIFCMPNKLGVNGVVYSSKPLSYNGVLIEDFSIEFKDGKAISCSAKKNQEALESLINFDEGSAYLGEVALVPYHSPISMSNILYSNTLYDENASCHLALGRAYPMNVQGGVDMSDEELKEAGANDSNTHVDFMFGTKDMSVIGVTQEGKEVTVFKNGDFAF